MDDERILNWLTSQEVFELRNEIEEVNRKMLDKLLDENEFLAVFFCKYFLYFIMYPTFFSVFYAITESIITVCIFFL